jgi:hypothetical protein
MRITHLTAAAIVVASMAIASDANAAICDSLTLPGDAQDVVIGEAGYEACVGGPAPFCYLQPYLTGPKLGVCWRDAGGDWQMEVLECTDDNTSSDGFFLQTGAGDDRVAVLQDEHTLGDLTLLPAGGQTGAMYCGPFGDAVASWHPDFEFTITAYLGTGSDIFHGSGGRDVAWTNAPVYSGGTWTSPADGGLDEVCTWGGNDVIYGDLDDNYTVSEDWMDAGTGTDYCDGDYSVNGSDAHDLYLGCETIYDALSDATLGWMDCDAHDDPIHDW